jgi:cysteinyl-tRNA synthetase
MSEAHLGATFDIHGGGLDLIFPHHENEIAQSCCAHGTDRMASVWLHNGFVQVEGKKMSKSEGNFVTIHDLLETETFGGRTWPGDVLRLAMLMTHYREPIDFSVKRLEEASGILSGWKDSLLGGGMAFSQDNRATYEALPVPDEVVDGLCNDLSFAGVLPVLHGLSKSATADIASAHRLFAALSFLGVASFEAMQAHETATADRVSNGVDASAIDKRVTERLAVIEAKNWAEADRIRDELAAEGILLKDGKDPDTGKRITTWEVKR